MNRRPGEVRDQSLNPHSDSFPDLARSAYNHISLRKLEKEICHRTHLRSHASAEMSPKRPNGSILWRMFCTAKARDRVRQLLVLLQEEAYRRGVMLPFTANTPYINTIPVDQQPRYPGQPRNRAADQEHSSLECHGDGRAGQQRNARRSAGTSRRTPRRRRCTKSGSTTSFMPRPTIIRATWSIFRGTPRRECTPARFSKGG